MISSFIFHIMYVPSVTTASTVLNSPSFCNTYNRCGNTLEYNDGRGIEVSITNSRIEGFGNDIVATTNQKNNNNNRKQCA